MTRAYRTLFLLVFAAGMPLGAQNAATTQQGSSTDLSTARPGRDPGQPIDEEYTRKIREYTTEPFFLSPLVDYLPASKTVPTPKAVLGDIAGAPTKLPDSKEVYAYMRLLAKSTPRVRVYSIGKTEEGREMVAVAVASEELMAKLDANKALLAKLADPRTIGMNDEEARRIAAEAAPVYYITGTIHSTESGAPTALMELAYRLAVDESPYIRNIRDHLITLITPIVEVDGRDRMVDLANWHMKHPGETYPPLVYWGHYVGHDNNRDAMGMTLKLTQNVLNTFVDWKAQVLHDLHESVPFLYDNTIGDGPFNAWLDPLLTNEWQMIGWNNVQEMTRFGMPGVFAHGTFDTWSPGYLMFIAATHNGISRLYETFGNSMPETVERTLSPSETERTWYRQNPPLAHVKWSLRNNNNYEQTGILVSLNYFANNRRLFLENFYEKSKRSILKPKTEGPAAYVLPADDPRPGAQAELLRVLQKQAVEISRATQPFSVTVAGRGPRDVGRGRGAGADSAPAASRTPPPTSREFPAGSYIIRMDQPYSRIADALLDYQYWSPSDPQKNPYDDTGWTFPEGFAVRALRATDAKVLDVPMERVTGDIKAPGGVSGQGSVFLVNHNADNALATLRYKLASADFQAAEAPFDADGRHYNRGSFVIRNVSRGDLDRVTRELGVTAYGAAAVPNVTLHPLRAARIALLHTWQNTQTEGWWRQALDFLQIPYDYISTQDVAKNAALNAKYDVILFPPGGGNPTSIIQGMPQWRNPLPWKNTPETPNIGTWAQTDDMRPGLGWQGLANLESFVKRGGVLVGVENTADFAVQFGLANGVSANQARRGEVVGTLLRSRIVDDASPIVYGMKDSLALYSADGESFSVSNLRGGRGGGRFGGGATGARATGRGTADDPDIVQGRTADERFNAPRPAPVQPWQAAPISDDMLRNPVNVIPPDQRPRVAVRFSEQRDLLVSGLLDGGNDIAQRPAVVDAPLEKGHVVLFANNPIYRGETIGSYFLVFNTILNFDNLNAGRRLDAR
ncbi:MAG TPA: M14 family zinc carboxypeptidase [Gemmatimonadaceae bacterium]|nr:M14 family zinc carboxypeptidase [Gemmatimonadaceae bacterium]